MHADKNKNFRGYTKELGTPRRVALPLLILPAAIVFNASSNVGGAFISTFITTRGVVLVGGCSGRRLWS